MWIIATPIALVLLFAVYNYVLLPRMNAKHEAKMNNSMQQFEQSIVGREEDTKKTFISTNENIKPFAELLNTQNIDAIISCQEKREFKDNVRQMAVNMLGRGMRSLTGVKVTAEDNEEYYFLLLTPNHLHYVHLSEFGECVEHLTFDKQQMQGIKVGAITSEDMIKNSAAVGYAERFSFDYGDKQYKFFFYDNLSAHPKAKNTHLDEISKINVLFAKPFMVYKNQYTNTFSA